MQALRNKRGEIETVANSFTTLGDAIVGYDEFGKEVCRIEGVKPGRLTEETVDAHQARED